MNYHRMQGDKVNFQAVTISVLKNELKFEIDYKSILQCSCYSELQSTNSEFMLFTTNTSSKGSFTRF